uniref:ATP synthase subunit b', chloroplastic n=1 Tax=Porphyra purpurea TaxID=2787 RepID=ATPF2_PORPU|nr:ATP synthase CF0 B' subunit [Porphyra purpurea]P51245.1 RecName: Full=ATP synthase subunit b', chloroplastic; AltName: Full=ATP synthase F(0) sector subunit b'; AltName: Full=ATPase subunit II [Porphyra purpurea]AAC08131.1 ATP synthase CF0 B' chain (subunit II) [Porphyra purpurea]
MIYLPLLLAEEIEGGLFDFNGTLPLMALQFLILMLLLNTIFYKPVTKILDERDEYIRTTLTTASSMLVKADELAAKYEEDLSKARRDAQAKIAASQKDAQSIVSEDIKKAQMNAEKLITEASKQLNIQKEEALKTLEDQVDTLSDQIKTKLLSSQSLK